MHLDTLRCPWGAMQLKAIPVHGHTDAVERGGCVCFEWLRICTEGKKG